MVTENYVIVYFCAGGQKDKLPGISWLKECYTTIDRRSETRQRTNERHSDKMKGHILGKSEGLISLDLFVSFFFLNHMVAGNLKSNFC